MVEEVCADAKDASPKPQSHRICVEYVKKSFSVCPDTCMSVGAVAVRAAGNEFNIAIKEPVLDVEGVCKPNPTLTTSRKRLHKQWCEHGYVKGFDEVRSQ